MKSFNLVCCILLFAAISCTKEAPMEINCIALTLEEFDMEPYVDQKINCNSFLWLYHLNGKKYFLFGNHCIDMISYPFDCQGNYLCKEGYDFKCKRFYKFAEKIGVIGIDK
jgi:hypothetical protein